MSETPQLVEYRGNCHCGAFKFKVKAPELKAAIECTCSICSKNGYLLALPDRDQFTVVEGDENTTLKTYLFGKKMVAHKFCPTCGTSVMRARLPHSTVPGPEMAINIRTLEDVDFDSLVLNVLDGAILEPPYQVPEAVAAGSVAEGTTVYNGNCHCGAVTYTLLSPEKISKAASYNCSICRRPKTTTVNFKGLDSAVEYTFATKQSLHVYCKTCGVAVYTRFEGTREGEEIALNLRTMNGLDLTGLNIKKLEGKSWPPVYDAWGGK
ncbi:Mss4-like protein [Mycena olivaceomarginata]|nr:Mss4-like protein [Mycena olivaceomarginata]